MWKKSHLLRYCFKKPKNLEACQKASGHACGWEVFRSWYVWIKLTVKEDETDITVDCQKSVLEYTCALFFKKLIRKAVRTKIHLHLT